jgi:hypothetical protein
LELPICLGLEWGAHLELQPHALPQGSPTFICELGISIWHNVLQEAMMFKHVREKQPFHFLGHGIFLNENEVCHLAELIHHHHDHIKSLWWCKLTMKSMDTLSHGPLGIDNGCNNHVCLLLSVWFYWQIKQVFIYSFASSFKLGQ